VANKPCIMQIDSKKSVINIQLRRLLTLVGFIAVTLAVLLLTKLPNTVLGLNKYHWGIVIGCLYILTIVVDVFWEYAYIFYSDEGEQIIIRYFSLGYFNHKKQSIEIPKSEFVSFVLKESLGGRKRKLSLRRYYKNAEAQYPPISLSILTKNEYAAVMLSLNQHTKSK